MPSKPIYVAVNEYIILFYGWVLFHCVSARTCMYVCVDHIFVSQCVLTVLANFLVVLYMTLKSTWFWTSFFSPSHNEVYGS